MADTTINNHALEAYIRHLADRLSTSHSALVDAVVRNNPDDTAKAVGIVGRRVSVTELVDLVNAMDAEEQESVLAQIPYKQGKDRYLDAAVELMREDLAQKGLDEQAQTDRKGFIVAAVLALASIVQGYAGAQTAMEQQDAAARAAATAAALAQDTAAAAARAKAAKKAALKKAAPWIIAGVVLIAMAIYKLVQK